MKDPIMKLFESESTEIDPKFKRNLRSEVLARSHGAGKQAHAKRRSLWPKLILVPAFAVLAVGLLFGLNIGKPEQGSNPLKPAKVSAVELIERVADAQKNFDHSKYNYFEIGNKFVAGPHDGTPCSPGQEPAIKDNSEYISYQYADSDGGLEIAYDGTHSVYDTSPRRILSPIDFEPTHVLLELYDMDGTLTTLFYDAKGNPLPDEGIVPTVKDGRSVYEFYSKVNPVVLGITRDDPAYDCSTSALKYTVVDAETYFPLEFSQYDKVFHPDNLIHRNIYVTRFANITPEDAIKRMEKAGFDMSKALPEYPSGRDGSGLGSGEGI